MARVRAASWRLAALGAVWLAFALRAFRLDFQELRGDEAFGYFFSLPPFAEIVRSTLALREPHPVFGYFLQHAWLELAGHSEFALRFVSLWFGVLAAALLYRLGRRLGAGGPASTLAAALLAASPYAIWHSQDARMYSVSLALTMGSTVLMVEALRQNRIAAWAAYVAVSWLALHTHYFAVFVIVAQNAFVLGTALVDARRRARLAPWMASQAILALLYLPWLILAGETLRAYGGNGDSPGFGAMLLRSFSAFAVGETVPAGLRPIFAVLAGTLCLAGMARLMTGGRRAAAWLLALYLGLPLLVTWLSALGRPIFNERYLIAAAPPFYLLLGVGVMGGSGSREMTRTPSTISPARWIALAGLVGLVLGGMVPSLGRYYADPAYSKTRGWRELAGAMERLAAHVPAEQARLAQNYPDPTLWYYYRGPIAHTVLPPAAHDEAGTEREVLGMVADGIEWVVLPLQPAEGWDNSGMAPSVLARHYTPVSETRAGGWAVQVYSRPPASMTPANVAFAGGLTLAAWAVMPEQVAAGGVLAVHLRWEGAAQSLAGSEKVTVQLLDGKGALAAQTDLALERAQIGGPATTYGILLPAQLASGPYRLIVAVYDPAQPGAPRLPAAGGRDFVDLGTVTVT